MSYSEHADLARLRDLRHLAPAEFEGYAALSKIVGRSDGAIPQKYRELIAIGVSLTTQCPYCLDAHTASAKKAGVTAGGARHSRAEAVRGARAEKVNAG